MRLTCIPCEQYEAWKDATIEARALLGAVAISRRWNARALAKFTDAINALLDHDTFVKLETIATQIIVRQKDDEKRFGD